MSSVIFSMSMSLDGFITGPEDDLALLHKWMHWSDGSVADANRAALEVLSKAAAMVMGRRMFDLGDQRNGWLDNPPFQVPIFVPSHSVPDKVAAGGTNFTFVTDGVVSAVRQAKAAAGDGFVTIAGGANVFQQALNAGVVDELRLHLVPVVLGAGIRLFDNVTGPVELEVGRVVETPEVTHVTYHVRGSGR
jgi:dihydrofolate reductase